MGVPLGSRPARLDPYLPLILATWKQYPKLPASRLYEMCRQRGYRGCPHHFRHMVAAMALMESPAILAGILLARWHGVSVRTDGMPAARRAGSASSA